MCHFLLSAIHQTFCHVTEAAWLAQRWQHQAAAGGVVMDTSCRNKRFASCCCLSSLRYHSSAQQHVLVPRAFKNIRGAVEATSRASTRVVCGQDVLPCPGGRTRQVERRSLCVPVDLRRAPLHPLLGTRVCRLSVCAIPADCCALCALPPHGLGAGAIVSGRFLCSAGARAGHGSPALLPGLGEHVRVI